MQFPGSSKQEIEIARQAMEACEHTIREMGAELHDDLVQKLSVIRLYLDRIERSASDPVETVTLISKMRTDFENVSQSIRAISRRLMLAAIDDESFDKVIHLLCQNMERPGGVHIHFSADGQEKEVEHLAKEYLYRIVQELIHNAFKHSAAWHIWVRMAWKKDSLVLEVEDDGTGFSKISEFITTLRKKHNTLNMRSKAIGASIEYKSGQKGLLAIVDFPFAHK